MNDPNAIYKAIGRNIRADRKRKGWTQAEFAEKIGHVRSSVANLEAGTSHCTFDTLCAIADALGISVGALLPSALLLPDYLDAWRKRIDYLESVLAQVHELTEG